MFFTYIEKGILYHHTYLLIDLISMNAFYPLDECVDIFIGRFENKMDQEAQAKSERKKTKWNQRVIDFQLRRRKSRDYNFERFHQDRHYSVDNERLVSIGIGPTRYS